MFPTLSEVKAHLRMEESQTEEDVLLQSLIDAAADYASKYIGRPVPWDDEAGDPVPLPASVRAAMLLVVGDLYANREDTVVGTIIGRIGFVERLLHPHRIGLGI